MVGWFRVCSQENTSRLEIGSKLCEAASEAARNVLEAGFPGAQTSTVCPSARRGMSAGSNRASLGACGSGTRTYETSAQHNPENIQR